MKSLHEILKLVEIDYLRVVGDAELNLQYPGLCSCINHLTATGVLKELERIEVLGYLRDKQPWKWNRLAGKPKKQPTYRYLWTVGMTKPRKAWLAKHIRKTKL